MYCSECGKEIADNSKFCAECGKPITYTGSENSSNEKQEEKEKKEQEEKEKKEQEEKEKKEQENQEKTNSKSSKFPVDIKYFIIGAVVLISILFISILIGTGGDSENNKISKPAPVPTPTATPEPVFEFDLMEMLELSKSNKLAAEGKYIGKLAKIEGKINYISDSGDYKFTVIPIFSDMFQMSGAKCELTDKEQFLSLRTEENITIVGRVEKISSFLTTDYIIEDCKIYDESIEIFNVEAEEINNFQSNQSSKINPFETIDNIVFDDKTSSPLEVTNKDQPNLNVGGKNKLKKNNLNFFYHLHCHSNYSVLQSTVSIESLIENAVKYNMKEIALTDWGNLFGAFKFVKICREKGIKPIVGCELFLTENHLKKTFTKQNRDKRYSQIVYAKNINGYKN